MSVKHVKDYYNQIFAQYREMEADIHDLEEAVSNNIVMPDAFEATVKQLDKLKENYQRINYIMFLLDMPNRKEKVPAYKQRLNAKLKNIPQSATLEAVKKENETVLNKFVTAIDDLKS